MVTLQDEKRKVTGLRKQFLKVKGKLWVKGLYIDTNGRKVYKVSDAKAEILIRQIDFRRSVFNAVTKGMKLCVIENGCTSSIKLLKVIDWGMKYGNNDVKVKRFSRRGKYYTGVWVKGSRGMQSIEKYNHVKKDKIYNIAKEDSLIYDNKIWNDDF